jgi:hypothetical protein
MYNRLAALSVGLILCFSGFAPTYAANSAPACDLKRVAELETKIEQNDFLIKVQLNDRDSWLNVATASPFSVISRKIADELKLSKKEIESADLYDGAGKTISKFVSIKTVGLAGMKAENVQFLIMGSAMTPPKPGEHDFEGGFGAEFLSAYDVELDLLHGKMALFSHDHCKGHVVYWTQDYVAIPFTVDDFLHISFPVTLDGKSMRAMLDTSSAPSRLSAQVASRDFEFDPVAAGIKPDGDLGTPSDPRPYYKHRFSTLDIGGVVFRNTELVIRQDRAARVARESGNSVTPMIIGLHHLGRLRMIIAYSEKMLYVSAADAN